MHTEKPIIIRLGKTSIEIRCQDHGFMDKACADYYPFMVSNQPDFTIELNLRNLMAVSEVRELLINSRSYFEGNHYFTKPELIEGFIDWEKATVCINTEKNLFAHEAEYKLMNVLLRGIYWGLYKKVWNTSPDAYLVHGCGIIERELGYLFTGPSGSGKTTLASLADGRLVLNDETVLIGKNGKGFYLSGTPFDGGVSNRCSDAVHLSAIFFLKKATEVSLRRMSKVEAYQKFLAQILNTSPLFEIAELSSLSGPADLSSEVASQVTFYELGFRPDNSFWEVLRNINERDFYGNKGMPA
jgi:hypothetical protein